jgi:hypothetical protein
MIRISGTHNHPFDEAELSRRMFIGKCNSAIHEKPFAPIPSVVMQQSINF